MSYKILSLDGGGTWAILEVMALKAIYGGDTPGHQILAEFDLAVANSGGSIVLAPSFSASGHWNTVSKHGVTYFGSVATMLSMLNNTYEEGLPAGVDTSSLRFALCGSAPVP